jgi:uncharacterized protein YcgI (DUF1989 family)
MVNVLIETVNEKILSEVIVPAGQGASIEVKAGQFLKVIDVAGGQIADFYAFVTPDTREYLSISHTRVEIRRFYLLEGDTLVTNFHRPIMKLLEDTCCIHDMSYSACNQGYYKEKYGITETVPNCRTNIAKALQAYGMEEWRVKDPLDLFQYSPGMVNMIGKNRPGSYVKFEVLLDAVVAVSSCPEFELIHGILATPVRLILTETK